MPEHPGGILKRLRHAQGIEARELGALEVHQRCNVNEYGTSYSARRTHSRSSTADKANVEQIILCAFS
jgi:hypothetical protein